jgi:hypothetical protein
MLESGDLQAQSDFVPGAGPGSLKIDLTRPERLCCSPSVFGSPVG